MAINPMKLMELKRRFDVFKKDHPKVMPFFRAVRDQALEEGTVLELSVVKPDGTKISSNIKLNGNDLETLRILTS